MILIEIIIQDTLNLYKKMLNLPEGERGQFFGDEIMKESGYFEL